MKPIEEYLRDVVSYCQPRATVTLPIADAAGLVLAEDAIAGLPVPPFSNSAMDGYLVNKADLAGEGPWTLPVSGDIPAGDAPKPVAAGTAQRIMTGAPVVDGAELAVIPVEDTNIAPGPIPLPSEITVHSYNPERDHIRRRGTNIAPGAMTAPAGTVIDAGTTAALISTGVKNVQVYSPLHIAVISTGDEVVSPTADLQAGQLPDSNLPMIAQLCTQYIPSSLTPTVAHCSDDPTAFAELLDQLSADHDLIITTGGVSVGAFDVTRDAGEKRDIWFGPINMKPGKPQGVGNWNDAVLLCLPGNPVAAWVSFQLFCKPAIDALRGLAPASSLFNRPFVDAIAGADFPIPRPFGRNVAVPVRMSYSADGAVATPYSGTTLGSHFVGSLVALDGLCLINQEDQLHTGDTVRVLLA